MAAATVGGDVPELGSTGAQLVGRREAASRRPSRRKGLGIAIVFAVGAATAGSLLGLLAAPNPEHQHQVAGLIFTTQAAVAAAARATQRADAAEKALAAAKERIDSLSSSSGVRELEDYREAERLGIARFMSKDTTAIWGEERRHVLAAIVREARRNGLDPLLVAAVIQVESHFDPYATSSAGACGLMQLMPATAQWLLPRDRDGQLKAAHLFNPILNIELGSTYLAQLMERFDGDLNTALIAYNAGPGTARSLTRNGKAWKRLSVYPKAVLAAYHSLLTPPTAVASR
jgi:soluble lytic murein transglycosylase